MRAHRAALESEEPVTRAERRVLSAITLCRTVALGGHLDVCRACGHEHPAYNSCRNRHCPKCQLLAQEKWIDARAKRVLPVRHFHVVFTLPSELRALARSRPKLVYAALFAAASATLLELGRSRLGAELGVTMVLHTWTRDLRLHPHVHAIVTAGGLTDDERWVPSSTKYLFPVEVMGALLRGKMLHALSGLHARGDFNDFGTFREPDAFAHWMARLAKNRWIVYAKRPFRRVDHVLRYLGRYTHRVGIANSRLVEVTDDRVTFRTKNGKTITLTPIEFLRRFLLHVLPDAFKKIRHYGLYAGAHVDTKLAAARARLTPPREPREDVGETVREADREEWQGALERLTGRDVRRCPVCNGPIVRLALHPPLVSVPAWDTS